MVELSPSNPLLFFGCGNMGRAMLDGWMRQGVNPDCFIIVDPAASSLPDRVRDFPSAAEVPQKVAHAILAIKPQMFEALANEIASVLDDSAMIVSVMAGVRSNQIKAALPGRSVVRLMPNLAAALGKSPLGLFTDDGDGALRGRIESLLTPLGTPVWIEQEHLMDAVTALAGSGPAFVYRFIDALAKAGASLGLEPQVSAQLAMAMVEGAVSLAASSDVSPEELAHRVTSPGGTTAAGLAVLDQGAALEQLILDTLKAARDRGVELSNS